MSTNKMFMQFLAMQPSLTTPKQEEAKRIVKPLIKPKTEEVLDLESIILKKPKASKVLKHLQALINEIVEENDI